MKMKPSGIREFFDYAKQTEGVISLGVGEPDFVTPEKIREAGKKALDEGKTFYTSNQGMISTREKVANYLADRFNVSYLPEEIILTVGSSQAILASLMAIINPGDEVIVTEPTYVCYIPDIEMCGGKAIVIPLKRENNFKLTKDELSKYITPKTKAVFLSYPNNPTGAIMSKEDLEDIAPLIIENDLYVISDEIYGELTYESKHCSIATLPNMKERTILISGFSKSFAMTGWRIGFVCASKEIITQILKVQQFVVLSAPTMSQCAVISALDECIPDMLHMISEYDKRRKYLLKSFKELGIDCSEAKGAFYLFPNITKFGLSSREFCLKLLKEYKFLVVPGTAFGESLEGYIRLTYATSMENLEKFVSTLKVLLNQ